MAGSERYRRSERRHDEQEKEGCGCERAERHPCEGKRKRDEHRPGPLDGSRPSANTMGNTANPERNEIIVSETMVKTATCLRSMSARHTPRQLARIGKPDAD